ncbi:MAG: phage tail tape measure protein [Cellulosilyticum sp.]|nr:phage tail tape measure protein [Cellulosilyticum sp.]
MAGYIGYKRTIVLDFNYDQVKQGVPKVNQQMALLNSEFNKTSAQVQATGNAFDKLNINNQKLANQFQLQKDKVATLQKELEKLTTAETKNQRAIASKNIELNNAQAQLARLQTAYASSNKEVEKSKTLFGQAKLELENFRLGAERAGVDLGKLKTDLLATTAAVVAFVGGTTKAYMSYEQELVQARNLMDENVMSYEQLNQGVKELANSYGIADAAMAKAAESALSSNVATQDLFSFLNEASRFSKATFTELNTVVDLSTSLMNSYGYSIEEIPGIYDQLINTQKLAKVSWEDYNTEIGGLTALGSQVGVSLEEINAALVLQTAKGIDSATALTNLKGIISALASPSSQAATKAAELGIKFNAAAVESKGLAGVMDDIVRACDGDAEAMATLFGNVRAWTGATVLAANGGKDFKDVLASLDESAGMLDNSLQNVEETTSNKWRESIERLKNSAVDLGESMAPIIEVIAKIVDFIAAIPAPVTLAVVAFASITKVLTLVSGAMAALGASGGIAAAGLSAIGLAGGISLPIILAIAGAIALVVAMVALLSGSNAERGISNATESCENVMKSATKSVNSAKSKKGYKSGTNYVKEDGWYEVNEGNATETFLQRGTRVKDASRTSRDSKGTDMSEINNLLKTLIYEIGDVKSTISNLPDKQLRLSRI